MERLNDLLKTLEVKVVVAVENDFTAVKTPAEAFGRLFSANELSWQLFMSEIEKVTPESYGLLYKFSKEFVKLEHNLKIKQELLSTGEMGVYLKKIGGVNTCYEKCLEKFTEEYEKIKDFLLRYGVYNISEGHDYSFLEELDSEVIKLIWNKCPENEERKNFVSKVREVLDVTASRFCFAVIDKIFEGESVGHLFTDQIFDAEELKGSLLSVVYTTTPDEIGNPKNKKDYFIRQVKKGVSNSLDEIQSCITENAWVILFDKFRVSMEKGALKAFETSISDSQNITAILSKSNTEGLSPFEALNSWFQLAANYYAEKEFLQDYKYIMGLSNLQPVSTTIALENELKNISSHEIFDYDINSKHLPISSGDIFKINEKYYLLFGQPCDLMIRYNGKDNVRSSRIAELIEISLENPKPKFGKFKITGGDNGLSCVNINNFEVDNDKKRIKIEISTKKMIYADFRILDLSMFNQEGHCKMLKNGISLNGVLPKGKETYYSTLCEQLESVYKYCETQKENRGELDYLIGNVDVKLNDFIEEKDCWNYNVTRFARIKPKFMGKAYQEISEYKSRIGLDYYEHQTAK